MKNKIYERFIRIISNVDLSGYKWNAYSHNDGNAIMIVIGLGNGKYLEVNVLNKIIRCEQCHINENDDEFANEELTDEMVEFEQPHEAIEWLETKV